MPRVSIILPNYNYARYLKERVRSILNQTMPEFELLYMDDASTDESNLIMKEFVGDPRVQMHCFTENSGSVYARRNASVSMAAGEWLWIAEADDSAHPRFLDRMLEFAHQRPWLGIIHNRMITMDSAGRISGLQWVPPELEKHMDQSYVVPGHEEVVLLTGGCFLTSSSGMLIRKAAIQQAGGYEARLKSAADWDLYLRILSAWDCAFCAEPLAYYRYHGTSVTRTTQAAVRGLEDAYCVASTYLRIQADERFTAESKETVLRRAKERVFDLFTVPDLRLPEQLKFAADLVYKVVQDKRLLSAVTNKVNM